MAIGWQIRRQNPIPRFSLQPISARQWAQGRGWREDAGGEGQNFLSPSAEFREAAYTNTIAHTQTHMSADYVQEIGLESELLLLHFPTLRIGQLTLFGCKSWGFVIYNQFSALVSSALACPFFFAVCILPWRPSQHSSVCTIRPVSLFLRLPPLLSPCTAEARQVCPSCASSGSCLPWYIIREPREHRPNTLAELQQLSHKCFSHMMLKITARMNEAMTQLGLNQHFFHF